MLKYNDASTKSSYFRECSKYAFALLRFSSLSEITEIDTQCKKMIAYIISNLSKLTAESKLFLDRLAKAYQNLYVPLLYKNCENIENSESYIEAASNLISKVTALVKENYVELQDDQIDIMNDLSEYVGSEISAPAYREAQEAVRIASSVYSANEQVSKNNEQDVNELEAQHALLHGKYKNTAVAKASALRSALDAYSSMEAIVDSCRIAKILRSEYSLTDKDAIVSFLDKNSDDLIEMAAEAAKKYLD